MIERLTPAAVLLAIALLSGCTVMNMKADVDQTQVRVQSKEGQLARQQAYYDQLVADRDQLTRDLNRREYSASQLRAQLARMSAANDNTPDATPQQRAQKEARRKQLADAATQAQAIDADDSQTREQKQRQLDALKGKTKVMLQVLVQG
jgi:chromosome segregation ATPase